MTHPNPPEVVTQGEGPVEEPHVILWASEQATAHRCSGFRQGRCINGFAWKPYCLGTLNPERTPYSNLPDCLKDG